MSGLLFALVLGAALMHATWNAIVKVVADRLVSLTLVNFTHSLIALAALPFVGLPAPESWPYLLASLVIHQAYYAGLVMQYRFGDLGQVYPLALGASPLIVAAVAWAWAGEALAPGALLAILLITGGTLSLAIIGWGQGSHRKAVTWAMFTALCIAGYSLADGFGGRASGQPLAYIVWLFLLDGVPMVLLLPWLRSSAQLSASLHRLWHRHLGDVPGAPGHGHGAAGNLRHRRRPDWRIYPERAFRGPPYPGRLRRGPGRRRSANQRRKLVSRPGLPRLTAPPASDLRIA
jgi:hypothetical protein